ncbi:MAG: hypothetical protein SF162_06035 [bacterium]|nr:hypothetical protein [bacterium]
MQTEIDAVRASIAAAERQAAALRAEIADLERELAAFQERYDKIITPMQRRLDVIREAIDDLHKTRRKQRGDLYEPDWSSIAPGYIPVEEQYRRAWAKPEADPPSASARPAPAPPTAAAERLKRIYRDLARRFHPDLAPTPEERARRTTIMSHINAAYTARDFDALNAIADHPADALDSPLDVLTLRALRQQAETLSASVVLLKQERDEMLYGAMMKLKIDDKLAALKGRDLLRERRAEMERDYDHLLAELDALRADPGA